MGAGLLLLAACITPPAVREAGTDTMLLHLLPPGSEDVALEVEPGVRIRGVFVPAEPGAPVVLHLLGSGGSVSYDYMTALFWSLRDRGFSSLALDYRGVGPSDGKRSPRHLRGDARAAFDEAVRRAGAKDRIVVRGRSRVTIGAAGLLDGGQRPAAGVLFAPVRSETVARNWIYDQWWDGFAFLVSLLLRPTGDADLVAAIGGAGAPVLAVLPDDDDLLPPKEARMVEAAVEAAGGRWVRKADAGHLAVAAMALEPIPEENTLFDRIFPGLPPTEQRVEAVLASLPPKEAERFRSGGGRARLEDQLRRRRHEPPALNAALVLAGSPNPFRERYVVSWLRHLPRHRLDAVPFEALLSLVDFADPAGDLDPRELRAQRSYLRATFADETPTPDDIVRHARDRGLARRVTFETELPDGLDMFAGVAFASTTVELGGDRPADGAPARAHLGEKESFRQVVRLALKAAGIPERMNGSRLEVWDAGAWRPLALE